MGMQVRAKIVKPEEAKLMVGYYGHQRRYQGDVFEIESEAHFSARWMERCETAPAEKSETFGARMAKSRLAKEHSAAQKAVVGP